MVIHEFKVTQKIVKNFLMAELNSVGTVDTSQDVVEAMEILNKEPYDIIFCGMELTGTTALIIHSNLKETGVNKQTPFVVISASASRVHHCYLKESGVRYVLPFPFTQEQISNVVRESINFIKIRKHSRYSIPGTRVILKIDDIAFSGKLMNISKGGFLAEIGLGPLHDQFKLLMAAEVTLIFSEEYDQIMLYDIKALPVRIIVKARDKDHMPSEIKAAWEFLDLDDKAAESLQYIFEKNYLKIMNMQEN